MLYADEARTRQPNAQGSLRSPQPPRAKTEWERRARKALDRWEPNGPEGAVAEALEVAFRDGVKHAAKLLDARGEKQLAMELQRVADEKAGG